MSNNSAWDALLVRIVRLEDEAKVRDKDLLLTSQTLAETRRTVSRAFQVLQKATREHDRDIQQLRKSVDTVTSDLAVQLVDKSLGRIR